MPAAISQEKNMLANGWRYPLVGGTRQRHFNGISFKPRKTLENAQSPTSRVHAVLAGVSLRMGLYVERRHSCYLSSCSRFFLM